MSKYIINLLVVGIALLSSCTKDNKFDVPTSTNAQGNYSLSNTSSYFEPNGGLYDQRASLGVGDLAIQNNSTQGILRVVPNFGWGYQISLLNVVDASGTTSDGFNIEKTFWIANQVINIQDNPFSVSGMREYKYKDSSGSELLVDGWIKEKNGTRWIEYKYKSIDASNGRYVLTKTIGSKQ